MFYCSSSLPKYFYQFQIKSIRKVEDQDGHKEYDNFRPIQARNDRIITFAYPNKN